jgi:outer membrane protein OmpA-like peptidoglycan-associated protein
MLSHVAAVSCLLAQQASMELGRVTKQGKNHPVGSKTFLLLAVSVLCAALPARAQESVRTLDLERLELNPSGVGSLVVGAGELMPASSFRSSILSHYEHRPLTLRVDGQDAGQVVRERLTLHLVRQYSLNQRVEFALQLPIVVYQSGDDLQGRGLPRLSTGGLSSPLLSARLALLRSMDGAPVDLALQVGSALPFGNAAAYARERGFTFMPRLLASRRFDPARLPAFIASAELGATLRPPVELGDARYHHQLQGNVGVATTEGALRGELSLRYGAFLQGASDSFEVLAGPRYALGENIELVGLASLGAGGAPGVPLFRVMFGVSFTEGTKVVGFTPPPAKPEAPAAAPTPAAPEPPKTAQVSGRVLDAQSGEPLAGALVTADGHDLPPVASEPATGRFLTYPLPAGQVRLRVTREGYEPVAQELTLTPGQTAPFEFRLQSAVKPARFLLSASSAGKPVAATVTLKGPKEEQLALPPGAAAPAKLEVPAGQYTITVKAEGFLAQTREVQVSEGGELKLAFELAPEPTKSLVIVKEDKIQILQQVHFATGKATLLADSYPLLDQVVSAIVKNDIKRVRIEGHTDNRGNALTNLRLSQTRAQAVADYLVKAGIDANRIEVNGYGGARPIAPNLTSTGRELNRRVEFVILER